jgi:hypothetical protein
MLHVLSLIPLLGQEAFALGCADGAAVGHLAQATEQPHVRDALIEVNALSRFERTVGGNDG